jgi:uncharacterized membrane protein YraQ (UPF0718 family)/YHS domain-containing protein
VIAVAWGHDIGGSLRESFFMFWETLWPLVLGFGLSGAVQAFVPKDRMERALGNHRPAAVARASGFGMVSSSCSYAATAMAKSLFQKGADLVTTVIFMVASTNLVVELGVVLIVLLGWQFAVAEFVGGSLMIVLLALTGSAVIGQATAVAARRRLDAGTPDRHDRRDPHDTHTIDGPGPPHPARTAAGWADAAGYAIADLTMLRRELVIGYLVAGGLTVLVPVHAWHDLFLHGHGFWTSLENAAVGPFVAIISFVCSIGNVPLAAALWKGGISFGGVISFIFADLITFPLLLIYRKYYGSRLALRLLVWLWLTMSAAGLAVGALAQAAGLVPGRPGSAEAVVPEHLQWNATTALNLVFLLVLAALVWLHRHRDRLGGGHAVAVDPVCGMQVRTTTALPADSDDGRTHYFCSDRCRDRFVVQAEGTVPR